MDSQPATAETDQQPEDNGGEYTPDDPEYSFEPGYRGDDVLAYWTAHVGPVQPRQLIRAQMALARLHDYARRSTRELMALAEHVAKDKDARTFWGIGKSPATWTDLKGSEVVWQRLRAHWLAAGGQLPHAEPTRDEVLARTQYQPIPPPPAWDRECPGIGRGCYRGMVRDRNNRRAPCPTCDLGKWELAYDTSPETLAAMDLSACGSFPAREQQTAA